MAWRGHLFNFPPHLTGVSALPGEIYISVSVLDTKMGEEFGLATSFFLSLSQNLTQNDHEQVYAQ